MNGYRALMAGLLLAACAGGSARADCDLPAEAKPGKRVSFLCHACHEFRADQPSLPTGPNLHDVYGRLAGSRDDFTHYSEGMKGAHDKGLTWTDDNLFEYIAGPKPFLAKVNGHDVPFMMAFQLGDEQQRKDVIAFLKAIKGKPECN